MKRIYFFAWILTAVLLSCASKKRLFTAHYDEYLVGCEYFAGWQEKGTKANYPGYPERIPLNGEYITPEVMTKDIDVAASHGVDFFAILWYPNKYAQNPIVEDVNKAVDWFAASPSAHKMKFMLEITNHHPFLVKTIEEWAEVAAMCAEKMKHPSYLKIDGRPVLKIHGGGAFIADLNHDVEEANRILARIREVITAAGIEEPIIAIGLTQAVRVTDAQRLKLLDIDLSMQYADFPNLPYSDTDYPYSDLLSASKKARLARVDDSVPFVPFIAVGWNPRPLKSKSPSFAFPTREEWKASLEDMKADLDAYPRLGFPRKDGTYQKAFTIYAWNEYGEGGILSPSQGDGTMKLEVIQEIFGNR